MKPIGSQSASGGGVVQNHDALTDAPEVVGAAGDFWDANIMLGTALVKYFSMDKGNEQFVLHNDSASSITKEHTSRTIAPIDETLFQLPYLAGAS